LESKGIEVYRINVEPEAYQGKDKRQTIRFYVQRKEWYAEKGTTQMNKTVSGN